MKNSLAGFAEIFRFELAYRFKARNTWVFFLVMLAIGLMVMLSAAGKFGAITVQISATGDKLHLNSPFFMSMITSILSLFGLFITASLMGNALYRDYERRSFPLFFSKPISRFSLLMGRFTANLLVSSFIMTGIGFGFGIAMLFPGLDKEAFGQFNLLAFLNPYYISVIPNVLTTGAIFFALVVWRKKMMPVYVGGIVLFIAYLIGINLMEATLDTKDIAAILDPFGFSTMVRMTEYWSVAEQNTRYLTFSGIYLINRLVWLAFSVALLAISYFRFSMTTASSKKNQAVQTEAAISTDIPLPHPSRTFTFWNTIQQTFSFAKMEAKTIMRSSGFIVISIAGAFLFIQSVIYTGSIYGTPMLPVTYMIIGVLRELFMFVGIVLLTIYTGELLWRDREHNMHLLIDSQPVQTGVYLFSKMIAVIVIPVVLWIMISLVGLGAQVFRGYFEINFALYAEFFSLELLTFITLASMVFLIHILINRKFVAHLVVLAVYMLLSYMPQFGLEHKLWAYGRTPRLTYSDMNGFGEFLPGYFSYKIHWLIAMSIMIIISYLFFVRGTDDNVKNRLKVAAGRFQGKLRWATATLLAMFILSGSWIYYNTCILNDFSTSRQDQKDAFEYEQNYGKFRGVPQPKVIALDWNVDLYPSENHADFVADMILKNKTDATIDSLHVTINTEMDINELSLSREYKMAIYDKKYGYRIFKLNPPLEPGEEMTLHFDASYQEKGFREGSPETSLTYNGTFFTMDRVLPSFGYEEGYELSSDKSRRKFDLPPKPRMADVDDIQARMSNYVSDDGDWIDYHAVIGTEADQTALTPGYLQMDWMEKGRHYFEYKMDMPILYYFPVMSARYEVKRDHWNDVAIEIYYDKHHPYNVQRMIDGIKTTLEYGSKNFSPYPHRVVRIAEFPRYHSYAQSFPTLIPFSESIGFIANVRDEDLDYPFYVTSHEMGHQWWAHEVIGGNVQGSVMMAEAFAQYTAMMVMKQHLGADKMDKYLRYELDDYMDGRGSESKKEMPLYLVENQAYIHYNKGSLVMYAAQDYLGEDVVNQTMQEYIRQVGYQEPPYTNSLEYLALLDAVTPDSLQSTMDDLFRRIVLYDNKATNVEATQLDDGKWQVTLQYSAERVVSDSLGSKTITPMDTMVDVALFADSDGIKPGRPIFMQKRLLSNLEGSITLTVDEKPDLAGIDPYHILIDPKPDDNLIEIE